MGLEATIALTEGTVIPVLAELNPREQRILEVVVRNYITNAEPTGSRVLSRQAGLDLSPATIRNIMSDLEESGLITQPHTSAGRVPTDKGYRYYIDRMMERGILSDEAKREIDSSITEVERSDLHLLLDAASRALSKVSNQLGVILAPRLAKGIFRHVHIFEVDEHRYMLHLTIDSGFVKTMVVEFGAAVDAERLETACQYINRRFFGRRLSDLNVDDQTAFADIDRLDLGVIQLFIPSIKKMLQEEGQNDQVFVEGETNIVLKPEFGRPEDLGAVLEVLSERKTLMHLIETSDADFGRVVVSIGGENSNGIFESFSVLKTRYHVGNMEGSLGIIGPKRMPYPYLISAVDYTAKLLGEIH